MTWTPVSSQTEIWNSLDQQKRVFDPAVFDNAPIFDTGPGGGHWTPKVEQSEAWTNL